MSDEKNEKRFVDKMREDTNAELEKARVEKELVDSGMTSGEVSSVISGFGKVSYIGDFSTQPSISQGVDKVVDDHVGRDVMTYTIIQSNIQRAVEEQFKGATPEARSLELKDMHPDDVLRMAGLSDSEIARAKEYAADDYAVIASQIRANPAALSGVGDFDFAQGVFDLHSKVETLEDRLREDQKNREELEGPAHDADVSLPTSGMLTNDKAKDLRDQIEETYYAGTELQEPVMGEDDPFAL